jgi:hypothetical protein
MRLQSFSLIVTLYWSRHPDVVVCSSYTLPVLTKPGAKYLTANNSTGTQLFAGSSITSTTTLYVYNEAGAVTNTCSKLL